MVPNRFVPIALVTLASLVAASSGLAATADHQQCYKIKDSAAATAYTADLLPTDGAFPVATGCEVKARAKLLCIDVEKTNVAPVPPGAGEGLPAQKSLCYKVKCPNPASPITATETDQFGVHAIEAKKSFLLCAPIPEPIPGSCVTAGDCSALANATVACVGNACVIGSCNAGFADCNVTAADGCEVNTQSDLNSCGGCGNVCPSVANGTAACTAGACTIGSCDVGFADCDVNAGNGCEASTQTDVNHCGACNAACPILANATEACTAGACTIGSCDAGFADCDSDPSSGCEENTQSDPNHCGACFNVCPGPTPTCISGACF